MLQDQIILSPNVIEDQKKSLRQKLKGLFPLNREKTKEKKKVFTANWYYIRPELEIYSG